MYDFITAGVWCISYILENNIITNFFLIYSQASERSHVIKVRDVGPKSQEQKKDLIYAPSCCKIDLSNPNKRK